MRDLRGNIRERYNICTMDRPLLLYGKLFSHRAGTGLTRGLAVKFGQGVHSHSFMGGAFNCSSLSEVNICYVFEVICQKMF